MLLVALAWPAWGPGDEAEKPPQGGKLLKAMLDGPMAGVDEIVFAVRVSVQRHYYENFGHSVLPSGQYPLPHVAINEEVLPQSLSGLQIKAAQQSFCFRQQ